MLGCQKLGLFRNVVVVVTMVGATAATSAFIEENSVGVRGSDGSHDYRSYVKLSNAAGEDNLAPRSVRSLPVPLMERRALLTVTNEGHESEGSMGGIRNQRKRRQRQLRSDDVNSDVSGARGSKEPISASSVRHHHPPCDEIEISASYLSASETTRSGYPPESVIDGDLDTHWATEGLRSWLMIDLPETTALQGVEVAFAGNVDGSRDVSQSFTMLVIGENKVIHQPEVNVGETRGLQYLSFERQFFLAKSVVFVGYGREGRTSLAEMKLCGAQVEVSPSRSPEELADNRLPQRSIPSRSPKEIADDNLPQRSANRPATRNLRGSRKPQA